MDSDITFLLVVFLLKNMFKENCQFRMHFLFFVLKNINFHIKITTSHIKSVDLFYIFIVSLSKFL